MSTDLPPAPGLALFRANLSSWPVETSIEYLIFLFKRRQIRGPRPCALATAWLLRKVVSQVPATRAEPGKLILRVQDVGKRLIQAAPRELTVGNIVRRVLGAIREEEENREASPNSSEFGSIPPTPAGDFPTSTLPASAVAGKREDNQFFSRPVLYSQPTGTVDRRPQVTSMFSIMAHPTMRNSAGAASPIRSGSSTPAAQTQSSTDFRSEIIEAISEIVDELMQADELVAGYALEYVIPQETILTYSTSPVIQRFLLKAGSKRKFTVIQVESYPNTHKQTHSFVTGTKSNQDDEDEDLDSDAFSKPLTALGITVLLVPDNAIFALMSRVNKVIISASAVLSNGSIVAAAGAKSLAMAAKIHRVPVMVLAETYKLSPIFPYDPFDFMDYGDVQKVVPYQDREMLVGLQSIRNPLTDFVDQDMISLFVTNLGGVATGYMYRTIRDQYHDEDIEL